MSARVALVRRTSSCGAAAARPAMVMASSSRSRSGTQRHTSPMRSASGPSTTWPNSTMAAAAEGPTARSSIQVWPPPGWIPSCRNRVSNRADAPARRTSQARARFMPGPHRRAVHRGQRGQRRAGHPQEALVDAAQALASRRAQVAQVGPGAERGRGARHHHRPHRLIGLERVEQLDDLVHHLAVEGVASLRVVERHDGHPVGHLGVGQGHRRQLPSRTTAGEWRKNCSTSRS